MRACWRELHLLLSLLLILPLAACGDAGEREARVGWAAAETASGGGAVLTTSDGGRTWTRQHATAGALHAIDFVDRRHGWVGGATLLLRTADGGRTWASPDTLPFVAPFATVTSLEFGTPERGVAKGYVGSSTPLGFCFYAEDGGRTWTGCTSVSDGTSSDVVGALCFPSPDASLAVLGSTVYRLAGAGRWTAFAPLPSNVVATSIACDAATAWVVGRETLVPAPDFAIVPAASRSEDGGHAWTVSLLPDIGLSTSLDAVAAVGPTHAWLLGTRFGTGGPEGTPYLIATRDAGASWTTRDLGLPPGFASGISFADESVGVVSGGNRSPSSPWLLGWIRYTADGGASWHEADVPEDVVRVADVDLVR